MQSNVASEEKELAVSKGWKGGSTSEWRKLREMVFFVVCNLLKLREMVFLAVCVSLRVMVFLAGR